MTRRRLIWLSVIAAASFVFAIDSLTPADICVSVLYVTIIMIVLRTGVVSDVVAAGSGCVALTTLSLLLIPGGVHQYKLAVIDYALSVFAIVSTSYLGIRLLVVEATAGRMRADVAKISRGISLSGLTAAIAHEINQPLTAIVANAAAARRWLDATPPDLMEARKAVEAVTINGERGGAIINGLKRLISTSKPLRQAFDVSHLIAETLDLMQLEIIRLNADVVTTVDKDASWLAGDRILLQQALMNLLSNALDAVAEVGLRDRKISIEVSASGDACFLRVKDTGVRIDPAAFDRLFDPFHSTKQDGMGIGLVICRSIIEAHGGSIRARPNEPAGITFEMKLPGATATQGVT